ncbi:MAG: twin-arginine translocase subunit TatC [Spirochaetales bacterium]|nr:twin-arginine translocase subunit TatC [Spirochaetales bacterium]
MAKQQTMPFWDHVYELRRRLLIVVASVVICSVFSFFYYPRLFTYISEVIKDELLVTEVTEGFFAIVSVSITMGIFLSLPVLLFETTLFIFPALKSKEKKIIVAFMASSFLLFFGGLLFAYQLVLPIALLFLKSDIFFPANITRLISYHKFITFFFQFLIAFGICFEFPIVVLMLLKFNVLTIRTLLKHVKHFTIVIFIIAAVITPPDVVSQVLLAVPMLGLYLLAVGVAKLLGWGK